MGHALNVRFPALMWSTWSTVLREKIGGAVDLLDLGLGKAAAKEGADGVEQGFASHGKSLSCRESGPGARCVWRL